MLINAQLRSKQEEIQPVRCDIACIVELSNAEFYDFQFNPLADHDFIKAHLPDLKTDEFHAIPCMLVLGEGVDDGTLEQHDTLDSFDSELTNKTVKLIKLAENGSVSIILINDQEIRKEQTDHANSNPSDAT